ncbi:MAG: ElyC/SanA/YdcF family protein [Candidatus Omnitrophica bacterium]|nr:ElyC/SanA/YdcF family protein [Candidatus Omnitrophota bacterium]MDD5652719.1 ElyC/SanA/YdcF family protein [Candidatus Omnitrophota bacterium]
MLKKHDIICISSIDWDFIWQHHQSIMSTLAKNGNRVLFIENTGVRTPSFGDIPRIKKRILNWLKSIKGFRREMDNLFIYSPMIIPFPYWRFARWINRRLMFTPLFRWMKVMDFHEPIIWTFLPTPIVLDLIKAVPHAMFIYYCTDNLSATSKEAKKISRYEQKVLRAADIVFVMAKNMVDYCKTFNRNVTCIPMGVDVERFDIPQENTFKPAELENINGHIVGYIGGVRQSIDQELVGYLAETFPEYTFVFVGPLQTNVSSLKHRNNIIFTGQKTHHELPYYIKYFDTCIIPYKKDPYTDNISAAKLNEYLIMGKPVVSTNLNEIVNFDKENQGALYIADNHKDFAKLLSISIKENSEQARQKRRAVAEKNSWRDKIELMSSLIEDALSKRNSAAINWQEKFLKIYKDVRSKFVLIGLAAFFAFFLFFYTPFVWFCAAPLKISQLPHKADAIVVFAGGVGESGMAGQGLKERVEYAIELYRKGYAKHIIISSGETYLFNEPTLIKGLADSLSIQENVITLEDKSSSTYDNVRFTNEILQKNHWDAILLVSSPYHMRRAALVFNKIAKDRKITFTPVPYSSFYAHPLRNAQGKIIWKRITLRQIKGVWHEYLGIIYYFFKNYI